MIFKYSIYIIKLKKNKKKLNKVWNYRMFDLAKDGLITMYVESKAKDYINQMTNEPVYKSLNRFSLLFERVCIK